MKNFIAVSMSSKLWPFLPFRIPVLYVWLLGVFYLAQPFQLPCYVNNCRKLPSGPAVWVRGSFQSHPMLGQGSLQQQLPQQ
jgi:hypothetical protein